MDEYINFTENVLRALGIFDFGIKWSGTVNIIMSLIYLVIFWATAVADLPNAMNDFHRFADDLSLQLVGFTGLFKYVTLIYSRNKIIELLALVKWDKSNEKESNSDHHSIVDHYDQVGFRFSKIYLWIISGISLGLVLHPLPSIFLGNQRQLPFPAVYPFSLNSTSTFTLAFFHQSLSVYIFFKIYLAFDTWFIFVIHHASGQFCLLQNLLENIDDGDQEPIKIREKIIRCARLHQNIFKFSKDIEGLFNISNLMQSLVSSISICISGYETVTTDFTKPQLLVKHISAIYGQVVQLLIFNWCGQLIGEKSFGVSLAISKSNWYKLEIDHQRDLGLILLRAQRPAYLTAGKFSKLSLSNFSNIMMTSFSYFTVLTSIQEDSNADLFP